MPTVGDTKFPYTKEGMAKAKAWSEMIGKPIKATPMPKKKGQKSKAKPMPRRKTSGPTKATPMKYQGGGFAEFSPGDATMTQREALKQEMMSPEYMEQIGNLAMGTLGGGGSGGIFKILRNLLKKPKAAKDWAKAKEAMVKAGRKDAPATGKTMRPDVRAMEEAEAIRKGREVLKRVDKVRERVGKPGQTLGRDIDPKELEMWRKAFKGTKLEFAGGGDIPEYGFGGWLKKRVTPSKKLKKAVKKVSMKGLKKGWDKNIKHGSITEGLRKFDKEKLGGRLSKAVTVPERYKGMSWKHMQKMKPLDFAAMGSAFIPGVGPIASSMLANKAQKEYGTKGLRGDITPEATGGSGWVDPNLFGVRKKFAGSDISGLLSQLQGGGGNMEMGGEVPAGRRMYGTGGNKKRRKK
jgi:hypothetical protein